MWSLPRSADDIIFDEVKLQETCDKSCSLRSQKFHDALTQGDTDAAFRCLVQCYEDASRLSAVDVEGKHVKVPESCFKKAVAPITKRKPCTAPVVKPGRQGDKQFAICQASVCG